MQTISRVARVLKDKFESAACTKLSSGSDNASFSRCKPKSGSVTVSCSSAMLRGVCAWFDLGFITNARCRMADQNVGLPIARWRK
ncbi:hypothetical protein PITC_008560 [Penicillium italicum]|uniref:Uncharacterized protein n=1 Tax=Penicillium italicum TaxID=40296 RepID=A0A0A2L2N7_PENIT|nr:hypothetical protein PITC_008560 [Penicillium italicum]